MPVDHRPLPQRPCAALLTARRSAAQADAAVRLPASLAFGRALSALGTTGGQKTSTPTF